MLVKLIREEGYMDEESVKKILQQSQTDVNEEKLNKSLLRHGFLTIEQLSQSTKDFFLQDVRFAFISSKKTLFSSINSTNNIFSISTTWNLLLNTNLSFQNQLC